MKRMKRLVFVQRVHDFSPPPYLSISVCNSMYTHDNNKNIKNNDNDNDSNNST